MSRTAQTFIVSDTREKITRYSLGGGAPEADHDTTSTQALTRTRCMNCATLLRMVRSGAISAAVVRGLAFDVEANLEQRLDAALALLECEAA